MAVDPGALFHVTDDLERHDGPASGCHPCHVEVARRYAHLMKMDEETARTYIAEATAHTADETVFVTSESGGTKGAKPAKFSAIPQDVLWELAEHYGKGEAKYPSDPETHEPNWQKGYAWSLSVDALLRHLSLWLQGEDTDEETGSSHLLAVAWHALALRWWQIHSRGTDDLPGRQRPAAWDDFHGRDCGEVGGGWPHPASAHESVGNTDPPAWLGGP